MSATRVDWIAPVLRALAIALALIVALAPFVVLFVNSVRPPGEFLSSSAGFIPSTPTLEHYREIFSPRGGTLQFLLNSIVVTSLSTVFSVALGAFAAYALVHLRLPFRLSIIIALAFLIVRFYPKITIAMPYFLLMRDLRMLDTLAAVIIAHVSLTVPFTVWLLLAFFEEFPKEIERSAMLDGCGVVRRFVAIVLPLSGPALAAAAILTAILSWNEFLMASSVTSTEARTLPVRIAGFITDKGTLWGPMSAMGSLIVLPVMIFALFTQRYLARGLTVGAVKG